MAEQRFIEGVQVVILRCRHFIQYIRMATDSALTEDHHGTGQDIRAFHRDGDRRALIGTGQEVGFAQHDAFTAGNIHCIDDCLLASVGTVVFHDGRQHRRFLAQHQAAGDQRSRGIHHIGVTGDTRQWLFDAFHFADRDFELTADMGVSANAQRHGFHATGGVGRQGDATAYRQTFNQHAPALTGHFWPANDVIDRYEHVVTAGRAVLERHVQREVTVTDFNARSAGWDQRTGDAR